MQQLGMQQPPMPVHLQQSQMPFAIQPPVAVQQPPTEAAGASISHANVTPSVVTSSAGDAQVCPITPQAYQKRERKALKITDPRTLEKKMCWAEKLAQHHCQIHPACKQHQ